MCVCSHRCKGASHYGLSAERKRRSQEGDCTDSTSELTVAALPGEGCPSSAIALLSDEPGLVNPAYEPSVEDNSQSGSTTSLAARSGSRKSECECTQLCLCVFVEIIYTVYIIRYNIYLFVYLFLHNIFFFYIKGCPPQYEYLYFSLILTETANLTMVNCSKLPYVPFM